jgi:hypothetical protein
MACGGVTYTNGFAHIHHRGDTVRRSDMSNLLSGLENLQGAKSVSPPIIRFYFFTRSANLKEIVDLISESPERCLAFGAARPPISAICAASMAKRFRGGPESVPADLTSDRPIRHAASVLKCR